jgi:SAM-dependent methyltransferase
MMNDLKLSTKVPSSREQMSPHRRDHGYESGDNGFDYETKVWGAHKVELSPNYLGALRLRYCLEDLVDVRGKVLEIGCGAGGMAKAIKDYRPDLEVYGCDISRKAIQHACQDPKGVVFREGDTYDLPFESESFSGALMFDLLEHLEDPDRAIAEAGRVLKSHGLLHFFVPCEGELHTLHGLLAQVGWRAKERYGGHIQRFSLRDLLDLFEAEGFVVKRWRWSSHILNQIADVLFFTSLSIRGKNISMSVEGYLDSAEPGIFPTLVRGLKSAIAVGSYYESRLLSRVPGAGIHIVCKKRNDQISLNSGTGQ